VAHFPSECQTVMPAFYAPKVAHFRAEWWLTLVQNAGSVWIRMGGSV